MDRDLILQRLRRILSVDFAREAELLTPGATLRGTLMMDSLDLVDLVFFIKREFGVDARMDEYREIKSLEGLIGFIERRLDDHRPAGRVRPQVAAVGGHG